MRKRRNSNDFKAYSANKECTEMYANVNISGTQRGTRVGHLTRHTGFMHTGKKKPFGSVAHRADRNSYRAKYTYRGEIITKTFKDERSAQAWLSAEKALVEADKAGIKQVAQSNVNGRKRL